AFVVWEVLQHVESSDEVEGLVGHGELLGVCPDHLQSPLMGDVGTLRGELQREHPPPEPLQHPGVATTGRADVQPIAWREVTDSLVQQVPTLAIPPMVVLQLDELADLCAFHARILSGMGAFPDHDSWLWARPVWSGCGAWWSQVPGDDGAVDGGREGFVVDQGVVSGA